MGCSAETQKVAADDSARIIEGSSLSFCCLIARRFSGAIHLNSTNQPRESLLALVDLPYENEIGTVNVHGKHSEQASA